mgnify:CR=1 FL=1
MKTFEDEMYKLDTDNLYKEYIRAFKYIWETCACHPDEIIIKYDNNTANFIYKIKDVWLKVLITKENKIIYEIGYKNETRKYDFETKEDYELYEEFRYYLLYHFDRLLKSCYNCATDTTGHFKVKNVDGIYNWYRSMS